MNKKNLKTGALYHKNRLTLKHKQELSAYWKKGDLTIVIKSERKAKRFTTKDNEKCAHELIKQLVKRFVVNYFISFGLLDKAYILVPGLSIIKTELCKLKKKLMAQILSKIPFK